MMTKDFPVFDCEPLVVVTERIGEHEPAKLPW